MNVEFSRLVTEYQDRVYNQAYRMLGNHEDAEEATQDVFHKIHRSVEGFRGESKMSTWIYRITSNTCINRLRKKQRTMVSIDEPMDEEEKTFADIIADEGPNPEQRFESNQLADIVRSNVRSLPPNQAMALSLNHFEGLSYEEIAEIMEIPKATVATYIFRGRKELAKKLMTIMKPEEPAEFI